MRALIDKAQSGVSICFNGKLMHGTRVKKFDSAAWTLRSAQRHGCREKAPAQAVDAFTSVSYSNIGIINNEKAEIAITPVIDKAGLAELGCFSSNSINNIKFEKNIFPIKLFPGFAADYLNKIIDIKPSAIIIESFGAGGLPHLGENLLPIVEKAVLSDIIVIISSQCFKGGVDLSIYEVGQKAMKAGAISSRDMTYEAAVAKLMWLLPIVPTKKIKEYFEHNFCDEIKNVSGYDL
jgi:L-asparaginase